MSGGRWDLVWGSLIGLGPYSILLVFAMRFAAPARRERSGLAFWRLLGKVLVEDAGAFLLVMVPLGLTGGMSFSAGWLAAGFGGLVSVAVFGLFNEKKSPAAERGYWRRVLVFQTAAVLVLTAAECALVASGQPWEWRLLAPIAVFVALAAGIYVTPLRTGAPSRA